MSARSILILAVVVNFLATFAPEILTLSGVTVILPDVAGNDVSHTVRTTIMLACHVPLFVAWVTMPFGWNPARYLYLTAWAGALIGTLVAGSGAFSATGIALIMCLGFSGGFLVCYVFFGDARHLFTPRA